MVSVLREPLIIYVPFHSVRVGLSNKTEMVCKYYEQTWLRSLLL